MWFTRPRNATRKPPSRAHRPGVQPLEGRRLLSAGDLDPTFGVGGIASISPGAGGGYDMALQPDGKVVAAGYGSLVTRNATQDFKLARLATDGKLDSTFGQGGVVTTDFAKGTDAARAVAVQADGKILAAGIAWVSIKGNWVAHGALARYNANGTLDVTFGNAGKVTTPGVTGFYQIAVQPDGKIVAVGADGRDDMALVRYNTNGSLDAGFGSGGKATRDFLGGNDAGTGLKLLPDGKILVLGWTQRRNEYGGPTGDARTVLVRFGGDGTVDNSFAAVESGAFYINTIYQYDTRPTMTLQTKDSVTRIVVGGGEATTAESTALEFVLERYEMDGRPDPTFGVGGRAEFAFDGATVAHIQGLSAYADGRLLASGQVNNTTAASTRAALARLNADGTPDSSFGAGGRVVSDIVSGYQRTALQADGRIVALTRSFQVARYQGDTAYLLARSVAPATGTGTLRARRALLLLDKAIARWRAAGADVSGLDGLTVRVAAMPGRRLARAGGRTITLDTDAAGWGWDAARGRGSSAGRMDLVSALTHEVGHLLGHNHDEGGVMAETLVPVTVITPKSPRLAIEEFRAHGRRARTATRV